MVVFDPERGYYSDDGSDPPVDPATGQPLEAPPGMQWGPNGWQPTATKPRVAGYYIADNFNGTSKQGLIPETWNPQADSGPDVTVRPAAPVGPSYGNDDRPTEIGGGSGGGDWFDQIGSMPEYSALERPDYLRGEFKPEVWTESFTAPTLDDLYQDPGYQSRMDAVLKANERRAASQGRILSGGYGAALGKEMQNFASNEYGNVFNRAADTYKQRYGEFANKVQNQTQARAINESAFQNDALSHLNQYTTRYRAYQDQINNARNADLDQWGRQRDLARLGLDSIIAGRA